MLASRTPSWAAASLLTRRSVSTPTTVSQVSPTLIGFPIGASVVKNRVRTLYPMIATGSPRSACSRVKCAPSPSSRLVRSKYEVSTPTTLPVRRRPSRVTLVLSTSSALVITTDGMPRAIACASA